jgi:hypothetical protein
VADGANATLLVVELDMPLNGELDEHRATERVHQRLALTDDGAATGVEQEEHDGLR